MAAGVAGVAFPGKQVSDIMSRLTRREKEVVSLLVAGRRPIEIAKELSITRRTVKAHVENARSKTGARTTIELAVRVATELNRKPQP